MEHELHIENVRHLLTRHVFSLRELACIIQHQLYSTEIRDAINPYFIYMLQPHLDLNEIHALFNKLYINPHYKYQYESDEDSPQNRP